MKPNERASLYQQSVRELAIQFLGGKCCECGAKVKLHIHHKDGDIHNNDKDNIELLCTKCHSFEHGQDVSFRRRDGRRRIRTTFYVNSEIHDEFKEICLREQESMSRKIEKFVARYVAVHMKGNPQLRLAPFIGKTTHTCFRCEGKFPILINVKFISGLIANVCRECFKVYKSQTTVDKVLGVTE